MLLNFHQSSTIFVSPTTGSDAMDRNGLSPVPDGCGNGPVKTVERALSDIGELRAVGDTRPMTIAFTEDYYIEKPINVTLQGTPRADRTLFPLRGVTFTSFGAKKRIIGGFKLKDWKEDVFNGRACLSSVLPDAYRNAAFTDLYIGGKPARPTRYPATGETLTALDTEVNRIDDLFHHSTWFMAKKEDLQRLSDIENATVNYYHYWIDEHSPVESYDPETGKITMTLPSRFTVSTHYGDGEDSSSSLHYYFEHIPDGFLEEGMWYLDRRAGKVYVLPEKGWDLNETEVIAPLSKGMFDIRGEKEQPISDIHITNLELLFTKNEYESCSVMGSRPNDVQYSAFAADCQSVCGGYGAVSFRYAKDCSVENCTLSCLGIYGIGVEPGCSRIELLNNTITHMAAGGIRVTGGDAASDAFDVTNHLTVRGNTISHLGIRYAAGCGILLIHTSENEISENEVSYLDYTGISVGFVWGYKKNPTFGNHICRNHIHHVGMGRLSDMGGIYLLGNQPGTRLEENRIHDVTSNHYGGWGIYTDEGSQDVLIRGNVVYNTKCEGYHQHYGARNMVMNNIFAFCGTGSFRVTRAESHDTLLFERNIFIQNGRPFIDPHFALLTLRTVTLQGNLFCDLSGAQSTLPTPCGELPAKEALDFYGVNANNEFADPGLADPLHFDFTPIPQCNAEKLGFSAASSLPYREKE